MHALIPNFIILAAVSIPKKKNSRNMHVNISHEHFLEIYLPINSTHSFVHEQRFVVQRKMFK